MFEFLEPLAEKFVENVLSIPILIRQIGPLFLGMDTHALSVPALASALELESCCQRSVAAA
jgi:phosphoglucomutase